MESSPVAPEEATRRLAQGIHAELRSLERSTAILASSSCLLGDDDTRREIPPLSLSSAATAWEVPFLADDDNDGIASVEAAVEMALKAQAVIELLEAPSSPVRAHGTAKSRGMREATCKKYGSLQPAEAVGRRGLQRPSSAPAARSRLREAELDANTAWCKAAPAREGRRPKIMQKAAKMRPSSAGNCRAFAGRGLGIGPRFPKHEKTPGGDAPGPGTYSGLQAQGSMAQWAPDSSIPTLHHCSKFRSASAGRIGRRREEGPKTASYAWFIE